MGFGSYNRFTFISVLTQEMFDMSAMSNPSLPSDVTYSVLFTTVKHALLTLSSGAKLPPEKLNKLVANTLNRTLTTQSRVAQ